MGVSDVSPNEESPLGDVGSQEPPPRWPRILLVVGIITVIVGGGYVAAAYFLGDRVPRDTQVAGVAIGGLSIAQAEQALETGLADMAESPVTLAAGEAQAEIAPGDVSLALDAEATVAQFTGFSYQPGVLLGHIFGLGDQPAVSTVDLTDLEAAVGAAASDLDVAPVEGAIDIVGTEAVPVEPADGFAIDVEETSALIRDTWLEGEPVEAVVQVLEPTVGAAAVEAAMTEIARPLTSGPISIQAGSEMTQIPLADLLAVSSIQADGEVLVLRIDGEALRAKLFELSPEIGQEPKDATVEIQGGQPVVVPAVSGVGIDPDALEEEAVAAALSMTQRTATVEMVETTPEFTTEQAEALGIVEKVSEFSTPLTSDRQRTQNLIVGTAAINGTIVLPGETFSIIEALGPVTPAQGYNSSPVVVDGFESHAVGGGLSQLATTTFNAAYFAGMDDIFHQPHSRWFDRYPEGREATMFTPSLDMKWGNNTDHGVLVQAWVAGGRTWVALWSTKVWDVDSVTGPRYNFTQPTTVYNTSAGCVPESGGKNGFTVQVTRTRSKAGEVVDRHTYTTRYQPWNRVVCGPPPAADPSEPAA